MEGNILKWYDYNILPHDHIVYEQEYNIEGCAVESFDTENKALPYAFKIHLKPNSATSTTISAISTFNTNRAIIIYADSEESKKSFNLHHVMHFGVKIQQTALF